MSGKWTLLILCCMLSGCGSPVVAVRKEPQLAMPRVKVQDLPPGAKVFLASDPRVWSSFINVTGTVLKSSPQGMALVNCEWSGSFPDEAESRWDFRRMKRTTLIPVRQEERPVLWISADEIYNASILEPPPDNDVPPDLKIDSAGGRFDIPAPGVDFESGKSTVVQATTDAVRTITPSK